MSAAVVKFSASPVENVMTPGRVAALAAGSAIVTGDARPNSEQPSPRGRLGRTPRTDSPLEISE